MLYARALTTYSIVQGERPIDDAAPDLAAPIHLRQDRSGHRTGHFVRIDFFNRGKKCNLGFFHAQRLRHSHRRSNNVDKPGQIRRYVDSCIGDHQKFVISWDFHDRHMTCKTACVNALFLVEHGLE